METRFIPLFIVLCLVLSLMSCAAKTTAQAGESSLASPKTTAALIESSSKAPETKPTTAPATATQTTASDPAASVPAPTRPSGGQFILPYVEKMSGVNMIFVAEDIKSDVTAWFEELWAKRSMDSSQGSIYDFVHKFNIQEADFRERNEKNPDGPVYSDEEIGDIFGSSKQEFINKYASTAPSIWVKGEHIYHLDWLAQADASDWAALDVTKDDILQRLEEIAKSSPEDAERLREAFGDKLK